VTPDELAAIRETVNEAGLDAENVFRWLVDEASEEDAIEYLCDLLRMRAASVEAYQHHHHESEVTRSWTTE
jgi:8-oxo-dGTP pyrophosphatase MutT (NUDIX family)